MKQLFNKTFFKFVFGFAGVVAVAVLAIFLLGAYQMGTEPAIEGERLIAN